MKKSIILSILLISFFLLSLQIFSIPYSGLKIIESNDKFLEFEYYPELLKLEERITIDNQLTISPVIKDALIEPNEAGSPMCLVVPIKITVPGENQYKIYYKEVLGINSIKGIIAPTKEIKLNNDGTIRELFRVDPQKYNKAPQEFIDIKYMGIARYRHIADVLLRVAQYDPFTNSIIIPKKLIVKIQFNNDNNTTLSKKLKDDIKTTINHDQTRNFLVFQHSKLLKKRIDAIQSRQNQVWLRITIPKEGLYRIDANRLIQFGFNPAVDNPNSIKIFGNSGKHLSEKISDALKNQMNEQPIIVRIKSNGELDYILFYGSPAYGFEFRDGDFYHYINSYSNDNYYLLTWGGEAGKRAFPRPNPTGNIVNSPATYLHRYFFEEEINHGFPYPGSGRIWYGRSIFPYDAINTLHNLDINGNVVYRFAIAHRNDLPAKFTIKLYNTTIKQIDVPSSAGEYTGSVRAISTATISAGNIKDYRSLLKFEYSSSSLSGTPYLDYYEIHYPRYFVAIENEISFFTDPNLNGLTEYVVSEFNGGEIIGFDVTDLVNPILLNNESNVSSQFKFRVEHQKNKPQKYYISSKYNFPTLERIEFGNLRTEFANCEMIVITHPDLLESANRFKEYREKQSGIKVAVIRTDHIFAEFSCGLPDPTAIRDFIAFAFANWEVKPYYILLWGRGHYDYKNIQYDTPQYVLTYQSADDTIILSGTASYTTDDYFARIVGDDRINDVLIGRVPVDNPQRGIDFVNKINHYENNSSTDLWRTFITLVADDSPTSKGNDYTLHTNQSERLSANKIPTFMQQRKIYLPDYPTENVPGGKRKPTLTQDLLNMINTRGNLILNWIGHGNPRVWAHEEILDRDITIPQMNNYNKLFLLTAATCDFARYDIPDKLSGAEEMLFSNKGGAIGIFAATRIVLAYSNAVINEKFYESLFTYDTSSGKYPTIGEVMYRVKLVLTDDNDQKFNLLADPSMNILIPPAFIKITHINDVELPLKNDTLNIKGLSEVKVDGVILKPGTNETDDTFNGTVILTMLDGDQPTIIVDVDGTKHNVLRHGGALNQSSYKVKNGRFSANFIIPKDINYSKYNGRLYAYAVSDDKRFAKGSETSFRVDGIKNWDNPDRTPPEIRIYIDSRNFENCDIVSSEPLLIVELSDDSGINTTGKGIGHKIEAWINDRFESIDLTNDFITSIENPKAGTVEKILYGLQPGLHKVKVRAWDVFNNFNIAEACFEIVDRSSVSIRDAYAYPNPTQSSTNINFKHNAKPPFDIEINIFDVYGKFLKKIQKTGIDRYMEEINWDGTDENNFPLAGGVYIYQIKINAEKVGTGIAFGKIILAK